MGGFQVMKIAALDPVEKQLEKLYKDIPSLPESWRKWLATYSWVFTLIGAVLATFAVLGLLSLLGIFSAFSVFGGVAAVGYALFAWLALFALIFTTVLSYMAVSPLKAMKKAGWDLLFYVEVFYLVYGVIDWLSSPSYVGGLLSTLIGAFVGFYVLFQVREYFTK